jgi:hypothetical protein
MANTFYTPTQVASTAVALAVEDSYLGALVNRNYESDLLGGGGKGRTVNIKVPAALVGHTRTVDNVTDALTVDNLTETTVSITLGTHAYSAVGLSEADLSLNIADFAAQVLAPQVSAVVEQVEEMVAAALNGVALTTMGTTGTIPAYDPDNPVSTFTDLRRLIRKGGVPSDALRVVCGVGVYADLLKAKAVVDVSQSGSTDALREGNVGRLMGMTIAESTRVGDNDIVIFHRDAFTLAVRAPLVPAGATFGQSMSSGGYSLRYLRDYDATHTQDRSIVSTFAGVTALPFKRLDKTTATYTDVPAAFRVTTVDEG